VSLAICGGLPARPVESGPRRTGGINLDLMCLKSSVRKSFHRARLTPHIHTHARVTTDSVLQRYTRRCVCSRAAIGHRVRCCGCVMHRPKRAARNVSAVHETSLANGSHRERRPANRRPHAPPATAGMRGAKSLDRCSARCGGRLPATTGGPSLPRGSASVVRQLGQMGTRIWSRRGRQIAPREGPGQR